MYGEYENWSLKKQDNENVPQILEMGDEESFQILPNLVSSISYSALFLFLDFESHS